MSNDLAHLGEIIGKAMASQKAQPAMPAVNVHVPRVDVSVDPMPLADAVRAGHEQSVKALEGVGQLLTDALCKSVGDALALIPEADLAGVEAQISRLADAIEAKGNDDVVAAISDLKGAFEANTVAVADLVKAVIEQNRIMMKSKSVTYDAQGRITRVEVS